MDFSVQIDGLQSLSSMPARVQAAVTSQIQAGLYASAQQVRTEAIKSVQAGDKSGRVYKRRTVMHRASAPGEAPASDTGRLVNSIQAYNNPGGSEAFVVAGRGTVLYAALLEFGTSRMAARPFMVPALEKSRAWINDRLRTAFQRGIKDGSK